VQYTDESLVRDSFKILGDTVDVDLLVYSKFISSGKVTRNDDYFVVKVKETPKKQDDNAALANNA
jgi:hypothetical protein